MFCTHKWQILSETITESRIENAMKALNTMDIKSLPHQLCHAERKHITIVTCKKCGKLKRFVEVI